MKETSTEEMIITLLKKGQSMNFYEIYSELTAHKKISQQDVKETVRKLLEERKLFYC